MATSLFITPIDTLSADNFTSIFAFLTVKELLRCRRLSRYIRDQTWKPSSWINKFITVIPYMNNPNCVSSRYNIIWQRKIIGEFIEIKDLVSIRLFPHILIASDATPEWINCFSEMLLHGGFNNLLTLSLEDIDMTVGMCEAIKIHPRLQKLSINNVFSIEDQNGNEVEELDKHPILSAFIEIFKINKTLTSLKVQIISWKCVLALSNVLSHAINLESLTIHNRIISLSKSLQEKFAMMVLANKTVKNFRHTGSYGYLSRDMLMPQFILSSSLEILIFNRLSEYMVMLHASNNTLTHLEFTEAGNPVNRDTGDCDEGFLKWLDANRSLDKLIMPSLSEPIQKYHMHNNYWNEEDQHNMYYDDPHAPLPHSIENPQFVEYANNKTLESSIQVAEIIQHPYKLFTNVICNHPTLHHLTLTFDSRDPMILTYISLLRRFHGCKLKSLNLTLAASMHKDNWYNSKRIAVKSRPHSLNKIGELFNQAFSLLNSSPHLNLSLSMYVRTFKYEYSKVLDQMLNEISKGIQSRFKMTLLDKFPGY